MKFKPNDRYFTIAVYTVVTVCILIVCVFIMFHIKIIGGYLIDLVGTVISLFKPLVFGLIIAYLLEPMVALYDKRCFGLYIKKTKNKALNNDRDKRGIATLLAFLTLVGIVGLFILMIRTNMERVMGTFSTTHMHKNIQGYIGYYQSILEDVESLVNQIPFMGDGNRVVTKVYQGVETFIKNTGDKILQSLRILGAQVISISLGFVLAFYLLKDKIRLMVVAKRMAKLMIPEKWHEQLIDIGRDVDRVFYGYIRGQVLDALIMATLISTALTLLKIDFAVIVGIISGIFNLIPYFGPIVGFILVGVIGSIGPDPQKAIYGVLAVMALQQLDGWVIVPRVVGGSVKLHPIAVLLAITIGGRLFGLVGLLLAVPTVGLLRLLVIRHMGDVFSGDI